MYDTHLKTLANDIDITILDLIKYFSKIGISKNTKSLVTIQEKKQLFEYLSYHNIQFKHISTFKKKIGSTLNVLGKRKKVQIEFRKITTNAKFDINNKKIYSEKSTVRDKELIHNTNNKITNKNNIISKTIHLNNKYIHKTINNVKKKVTLYNQNSNPEKLKIKRISNIVRKKNKFTTNKEILLNTKISQKTLNNKTSHRKNSYFLFNKSNNYKNNLSSEQKYRNRIKKVKNVYANHKNEKIDNPFEKKVLQSNIKHYNHFKNSIKNSCLQQVFKKPNQIINKDVILGNSIVVSELANKMAIKVSKLMNKMITLGITSTTVNQILDQSTAKLLATEMGHKVIIRQKNKLEESLIHDRNVSSNHILKIRPPVVTIMGHVDHGKTSLLDCIRATKVVCKESGGITQRIGAYHTKIQNNIITFLDTPGHAAFTAMRLRGAKITDIIVLVVAVDDGVKPQTIEAIQHSKAANVPIIVAINKIDKLEKDELNQIKNELSKYDILSEEWGGQNIFVNVSAKNNIGIKNLLNAILLQSEILELQSVENGMAKGTVIESYLDKGKGPIATVLVKEGTLKKGDIVISGIEYGKIRSMRNEDGDVVTTAGPSIPIEIIGLSGIPLAGDQISVVTTEKKAREVALYRKSKSREIKLSKIKKVKLENLFDDIKKKNVIQLKLVLKVDVQGSLEAIIESLHRMSTEKIMINIISSGVGEITETDASLAAATNAIILGFNVKANFSAKKIIDFENVDLRHYTVIYSLLSEIKIAIDGLLIPKHQQKIVGVAEVRNIFKSPKFNTIAGCMIVEGIIKRNNPIRISRNNIVIYKGELESIRRFKEDVDELRSGIECGIGVKNYNDIRIGDKIEVFEVVYKKQ